MNESLVRSTGSAMGCVQCASDGDTVSIDPRHRPSNAKDLLRINGYVGPPSPLAFNLSRAYMEILSIINCDVARFNFDDGTNRTAECTPVCQVGYVQPSTMFATRCLLNGGSMYMDLYFIWIGCRTVKLIGFNTVPEANSPLLPNPTCGSGMTEDVDLDVCIPLRDTLV